MDTNCSVDSDPRTKRSSHTLFNKDMEFNIVNDLPAHIVDKILSKLPIKDAVRTSILATQWQYRWLTMPELVFDEECFPVSFQRPRIFRKNSFILKNIVVALEKFIEIVDRVISLHSGDITKFNLSYGDILPSSAIDRWVLKLSQCSIKELILKIRHDQLYKLPSCFYSLQKLEDLKLCNCLLLQPPTTFSEFRCLERAVLTECTVDQNVLENLISNSPLLERLTVQKCNGLKCLKVGNPMLKHFCIEGSLAGLSFQNCEKLMSIFINVEWIAQNEENPKHGNTNNLASFFDSLPHLHQLHLEGSFLKYLVNGNVPALLPHPCLELESLTLRINFNDLEESLAALYILRNLPNLIKLELVARCEDQDVEGPIANIWEGAHHWDCSFNKLKVVKILEINDDPHAVSCVKFLLSTSPVLESMSIRPVSRETSLILQHELMQFDGASRQGNLSFLVPIVVQVFYNYL